MVLLAAFLTQVGALQTAPVLLAVTAYLAMEGIRYFVASRKQEAAASPQSAAEPNRAPG